MMHWLQDQRFWENQQHLPRRGGIWRSGLPGVGFTMTGLWSMMIFWFTSINLILENKDLLLLFKQHKDLLLLFKQHMQDVSVIM